MTKILSRSEIDNLLGRDSRKRIATSEELRVLKEAIDKKTQEMGLKPSDKLPRYQLEKIVMDLGFEDIDIWLD